jgi:hypothetical protein
MALTWFAPIFLMLFIWSCLGQRRWMAATVMASFFQAASPLLLTVGGRYVGVQPAYLLLPIGAAQFLMRKFEPRLELVTGFRLNTSHLLLAALTAICIVGAFLLPRVFSGLIQVMSARGYYRVMVHSSGGNAIQAVYVLCNSMLFVLAAAAVYRGIVTVSQCIRYLAAGSIMAAILGIYQTGGSVLHLPWPDMVFNSNLGAIQQYSEVSFGGTKRMSSTFLEPSMFAMHFLGMFALFAFGARSLKLSSMVLICLLVSTSSTAYAGLLVLMVVWAAFDIRQNGLSMRWGLALSLSIAAIAAACIALSVNTHNLTHLNYISEKLASHSGRVRIEEDTMALRALVESWGLGVGVGTTRASSFLTTFLACTGILGVVCLVGFFWMLVSKAVASSSQEIRGLGFALSALVIAWVLSVPDLAMPMIWLIAGVISGFEARVAERESPTAATRTPSNLVPSIG